MNYYNHHLGDYAKDTSHLTILEHGAYRLLLDRYYATERPIPSDQVYRVSRARSREEKAAVDTILDEFFTLEADGWHNARCDAEIVRCQEGNSEREQRANNEKERVKRHREERSRLFSDLRTIGITPKWDTPVTELRDILNRACNAPVTRTQHVQEQTCNAPDTAYQEPIANNQKPNKKPLSEDTRTKPEPESRANTDSGVRSPPNLENVDDIPPPSKAGAICCAIRSHGIANVSPSHPKLAALIEAGAGVGEFDDAAREAAAGGKGFAWVLAVVDGRRRDAASVKAVQRAPPNGSRAPSRDESRRIAAETTLAGFRAACEVDANRIKTDARTIETNTIAGHLG
ncbi:MAG: DUF1376 domain-containing protein [Azoarcus sp.]|jgi:uncharacterized protein YdaU (DUF1376 family)|nr:DUF1376 domain-containing protein [Azoarcus sp.]